MRILSVAALVVITVNICAQAAEKPTELVDVIEVLGSIASETSDAVKDTAEPIVAQYYEAALRRQFTMGVFWCVVSAILLVIATLVFRRAKHADDDDRIWYYTAGLLLVLMMVIPLAAGIPRVVSPEQYAMHETCVEASRLLHGLGGR